jgi:hypothetical protein
MQFIIRNRIFQIKWQHDLLFNEILTSAFIVLAFWCAWQVKSFGVTICNFDLQTWNPTNKFTEN